MFEKNQNHVWYSFLDDIMENYNTQVNRAIGEQPIHVTEENKSIVWARLFGHMAAFKKPRYKVGDHVRVLNFTPHVQTKEYQKYFRETYGQRINSSGNVVRQVALGAKKSPFSDEVFQIDRVLIGDPVVYKLYSEEAEVDILGKFYESELSLVR